MGRTAGKNGRGRPRLYKTAEDLRKAVDAYFDSISRVVPVTEWVPTGETDYRGKPELEERMVIAADGNPMMRLEYTTPPTVTGLCLHLGILRDTWSDYGDEKRYPGYSAITRHAKLRLEAYVEEQLLLREKNVQGLIFNLENNYGWRDRKELELGAETRKTLPIQQLTIAEKIALIRQAAIDNGLIGDHDGDADSD